MTSGTLPRLSGENRLAQSFECDGTLPPGTGRQGLCGDSKAGRSSCSLLSHVFASSIVDLTDPRQIGKEAPGMNRRAALMLTMLLGVLLPSGLWAQETPTRRTSRSQSGQGKSLRPTAAKDPADADDREEPATADDPPAGLLHESGFQMRTFDISRYTKVAQGQQNPQKAIVEWIFRRTGSGDWHGEKIAVLCAARPSSRLTTARRCSSKSPR